MERLSSVRQGEPRARGCLQNLTDGTGRKHESWGLCTWVSRREKKTGRHGDSNKRCAGEMVSSLAGAAGNHVDNSNKRGGDWSWPQKLFLSGQTSEPKSPIADCGVYSAIERTGNAQMSQGLGMQGTAEWEWV